MTENKGDLISRSELKKAINDFYDKLFVGCVSSDLITFATGVDCIIDNAPTVEPTCQNSRQVEPERSQNQWKSNKYGEHFCPRCGNYALYKEEQDNEYYEVQSNFCPECGFELRGGAE